MSRLCDQLEAEAGERVGGGRADQQREQRRAGSRSGSSWRARAWVSGTLQLIDPVVERRREVEPGDAEARDREGLERRAQAGRQAPVQREQEDQRDQDREQRIEASSAAGAVDRARRVAGQPRPIAAISPLTAPERQAAHDEALGEQRDQHRRDHRDHRAHRHEPELHAAGVDAAGHVHRDR